MPYSTQRNAQVYTVITVMRDVVSCSLIDFRTVSEEHAPLHDRTVCSEHGEAGDSFEALFLLYHSTRCPKGQDSS
jgi:hypothetical protein